MKHQKWLVADTAVADHHLLSPHESIFSSFGSQSIWAIPVEDYPNLISIVGHISSSISNELARMDYLKLDVSAEVKKKMVRPLTGILVYVLFDRLIRVTKLAQHQRDMMFKVPNTYIFDMVTSKEVLYAMARDNWVFNQYLINEFSGFERETFFNEDKLSNMKEGHDHAKWTFYGGYTDQLASLHPLKKLVGLMQFKIRQNLHFARMLFQKPNLIPGTGIVYHNKYFRKKGMNNSRTGPLFLNELFQVDQILKKIKPDIEKRRVLSEKFVPIFEAQLKSAFNTLGLQDSEVDKKAQAFSKLFFEFFPLSGLEGAPIGFKKALKCLHHFNKSKAFLTSYTSASEYYLYVNAAASHLGYTMYGIQHSGRGGYLANDPIIAEENISGSDYYITSGWTHPESHLPSWKKAALPMSSPAYSEQKKWFRPNSNCNNRVLIALGEIFRFPVVYDGTYYVDTRMKWAESIEAILKELSDNNVEVWIKTYCTTSLELLRSVLDKWLKDYSSVVLLDDIRKGKARELFNEVSATIWDVPAGGFIESLFHGTPAFSLSSPDLMRFQPEAEIHIQSLIDNGLLNHDPVTLAKNVRSAITHKDWWKDPNRKIAIDSFMDAYVKTDDNWQEEWMALFKKILKN
ncbi:MAG: hypothetical protein HRT90_01445 [Candidatus Margulisbacteria bacterium]|nr:hypothetical protein [Candidatus Margulisiibacteriota bacterium]